MRVRRIHAGGAIIDPEVVVIMMARASLDDTAMGRLTTRQHEVLKLVAEGRSNGSIAAALVISEKAVVQHTSRIYDTLGLSKWSTTAMAGRPSTTAPAFEAYSIVRMSSAAAS